MIITYNEIEYYEENFMPRPCFSHGDRTCYILTDESIEKLNKEFGINLWSEYDATLNVFADGTVNLMKMFYNNHWEEFQEEELYVLSPEEFKKINLQMK